MAASTTSFSYSATALPAPPLAPQSNRRRISHQAGCALEILGHAIEYLADEYLYEGGTFSADDPRLQAVHLLMALNREIYFECPIVPSFRERWHALLHALHA
jgi:hypothetical protein